MRRRPLYTSVEPPHKKHASSTPQDSVFGFPVLPGLGRPMHVAPVTCSHKNVLCFAGPGASRTPRSDQFLPQNKSARYGLCSSVLPVRDSSWIPSQTRCSDRFLIKKHPRDSIFGAPVLPGRGRPVHVVLIVFFSEKMIFDSLVNYRKRLS